MALGVLSLLEYFYGLIAFACYGVIEKKVIQK